MTSLKIAAMSVTALVFTACSSSDDISERNPDYFGASLKNGVISGSYNPAGYSAQIVQAQIKSICVNDAVGTYSENAAPNGLIAFQATCAEGAIFKRAFAEIERMPNGNFSFEIIGS